MCNGGERKHPGGDGYNGLITTRKLQGNRWQEGPVTILVSLATGKKTRKKESGYQRLGVAVGGQKLRGQITLAIHTMTGKKEGRGWR